jgi:hypothetical protein
VTPPDDSALAYSGADLPQGVLAPRPNPAKCGTLFFQPEAGSRPQLSQRRLPAAKFAIL